MMSQKSNVGKECDTNKVVDSLMAKYTPKTECNTTKSSENDHESLDDELTLSAMIFASDSVDSFMPDFDDPSYDVQGIQLEDIV